MKATPIISQKVDWGLFILPGLVSAVAVVVLNEIVELDYEFSPLAWLLVVVFIDVAHVWSTLFRTYLHKVASKTFEKELLLIPLAVWLVGTILYAIGAKIFWTVMAYLALFHFIKQQIGFLKLYQRKQISSDYKQAEVIVCYFFMVLPVLFWHFSVRDFYWFTPGDFFSMPLEQTQFVFNLSYGILFCVYIFLEFLNRKNFNFLKTMHILVTAAVWLVGIVVYNQDWSFTLTNVVHHGIPYLGLIYLSSLVRPYEGRMKIISSVLNKGRLVAICIFMITVLSLGYFEEFLWDMFVWGEHQSVFFYQKFQDADVKVLTWLVPLLSLPQVTHYVLDGIIWKHSKRVAGFRF